MVKHRNIDESKQMHDMGMTYTPLNVGFLPSSLVTLTSTREIFFALLLYKM